MAAPFDDRDGFIWYDGEMKPWRESTLHVLSHALHYGSSIFEGIRVYAGTIFKLREHTLRLIFSAEQMGFHIPFTADQIDQACLDVVKVQKISDGYLRPVAWRGSEMMGVSAQQSKIHLAVAAWEWPSYFSPEARAKGIRMITSRWRRPSPENGPVKAKAAGLYMICTLSKHEAEAQGCHDALMHDYRGLLAEATGANLFLAIDGKLHTPTPDCFLDGITRQTVIGLAKARGIEVVERHINPDELKLAQEIFLTGTAAEITPVGQIDSLTFTPGRLTEILIDDYTAATRNHKAAA